MRHPAGHDRQLDQLGPGLRGDEFRHFFGELRLAHHNRHMVGLHPGDQILDVMRRRINSGFQFDGAPIDHAETVGEIGPVFVIGNKLRAFERFALLLPLGDFRVEFGEVSVAIAREVGLKLRAGADQSLVNVLHRRLRQHRVEHVVRVAVGMHVSRRVVGGLGHFDGVNALRAIHVARMPVLDAGILAGFNEGRQEGVLAAQPH